MPQADPTHTRSPGCTSPTTSAAVMVGVTVPVDHVTDGVGEQCQATRASPWGSVTAAEPTADGRKRLAYAIAGPST